MLTGGDHAAHLDVPAGGDTPDGSVMRGQPRHHRQNRPLVVTAGRRRPAAAQEGGGREGGKHGGRKNDPPPYRPPTSARARGREDALETSSPRSRHRRRNGPDRPSRDAAQDG